MKKIWFQIVGLLCAVMVFGTSFVYASSHLNDKASLHSNPVSTAELNTREAAAPKADPVDTTIVLPQAYVELPQPVINDPDDVPAPTPQVPAPDVNLITPAVKPPADIKPSSTQNVKIEQDLSGTTTANTKPTDSAGPPIDDNPDAGTSSESSSVPPDSSASSAPPVSENPDSGEANPLETALGMPAYTPYGKTLSINWNGTSYKADAVVVISAMLQSEMVGSGSGASYYYEAYKAQAIACHSYVKNNNNKGLVPSVYARTPSAQTVRLVEQVVGQMVYYNGSVAETVYCASSGLHTQGNQYYWGGSAIAYLQGVDSKYDEDLGSKTFTLEEMRAKLSAKGYDTSGDPSTWFQILSYSDGNFINRIKICGQEKSGMTFHFLLNLKSSKAQIAFDGATFYFTTNGYGHGVGMSQTGAMGYARYDGWSYSQILSHYYPGTSIQ